MSGLVPNGYPSFRQKDTTFLKVKLITFVWGGRVLVGFCGNELAGRGAAGGGDGRWHRSEGKCRRGLSPRAVPCVRSERRVVLFLVGCLGCE